MNTSSISFGKKYISETPVRSIKTGEKTDFNFVELEPEKDIEQVKEEIKIWQKGQLSAGYITAIKNQMEYEKNKANKKLKYYALEDKDGSLQSICSVKLHPYINAYEITAFQAKPENKHFSKKRKYSKIGISTFKEIVKVAKDSNIKYIGLADLSGGFWNKVPGMKRTHRGGFSDTVLFEEDYDNCIKKINATI